jgi:hypothetical protein
MKLVSHVMPHSNDDMMVEETTPSPELELTHPSFRYLSLLEKFVLSSVLKGERAEASSHIDQSVSRYIDYLRQKATWEEKSQDVKIRRSPFGRDRNYE